MNMGIAELRRLRQLEEENRKLKGIVADLTLDKKMPHRDVAPNMILARQIHRAEFDEALDFPERPLHSPQKAFALDAKLVRCTRGAIFDVAIDLRPECPSFANGMAGRQHCVPESSPSGR